MVQDGRVATSGPPIKETQAVVRLWADWFRRAEPGEIGDGLSQLRESGIDPFEAVFAEGVRRFEKSGEYVADGALGIVAWLRSNCKLSGGAAAERVEIARQLEQLPKTEAAFARGELGYQHVAVLAHTAQHVGVAAVQQAEASLLKAAEAMDPGQFTGVAKNFEHRVDTAAALVEANRAYERRYLHVSEPTDGMVRLDGLLDVEGGAILRTLLAAPGAPAGELEVGGSVPAESVRRLACDAALTRITARGELEAEISRASRSIPPSTRRALEARDRTCVAGRCDRPPQWADCHHLKHWTQGGPTILPNLVLLCRRHHRMVHEGGWGLRPGEHDRWGLVPPVKLVAAHARSA